uniref:Uncharacterized protein n=1 Tax=Romanomermis culicivorax TaxID=13658 RepID=A0A915L1S9_ROMCU
PVLLEPKVTETVSTVEETKRTEEVERRVRADKKHRRKEHKTKHHRSHEGHLEDGGQRQERIGYSYGSSGHAGRALDYPSWNSGEQRSSFGAQNGYRPGITETYQRESTTRRMHESDADDQGRLRYAENGDVNNGQDKLHRSYSSTNVYREFPRQTELYYENGRPIVEYPPSTTATMDDRFYNRHGSRHLGRYGR